MTVFITKIVIQGGALRIRIRLEDTDPRTTRIPLTSVADPDPGSGALLTPGSGMGKKSGSGSGMKNLDHISESLETIFWVKIKHLKFFDSDPGSGMKKFGSGIRG
jgi:hypothetical protein